jgi:RNA polymerase sigma-70 factor (ECF subfamily)
MLQPHPGVFDLYESCIRSRQAACEAFFQLMNPVFRRTAYRVARQYDGLNELDDLMQEIGLKLTQSGELILASLPKDETSAKAFLSVTAANTARDFFRNRGAMKRGRGRTVALDAELMSALQHGRTARDAGEGLLMADIEKHLPPERREKTVFGLYFRQGFTAKEIAAIPALGLSVKGVESMIHRLVTLLRKNLAGPPPTLEFEGDLGKGPSK